MIDFLGDLSEQAVCRVAFVIRLIDLLKDTFSAS